MQQNSICLIWMAIQSPGRKHLNSSLFSWLTSSSSSLFKQMYGNILGRVVLMVWHSSPSCSEFHCCRRFCIFNWFFWGSSGFISFQSPCTSSSHVCTCFLLWAAANWACQTTIDLIRSRTHTSTHTFKMLYLYLLIKFARAGLVFCRSSEGSTLNLLIYLPLQF